MKKRPWILFAGILVFLALGTAAIGSYLSPDDLKDCLNTEVKPAKCQTYDAIIAVSGGDTNARAAEAIKLYKRGFAPIIIFSGAAADPSGPSNAAAMRKIALGEEVPASSIVIEEFSRTTAENAEKTAKLVDKYSLKNVILVTSGYHQRRANLEFRNSLGSDVTIVNHPVGQDKDWSSTWWLTTRGWWLAMSELVKICIIVLGGA